MQKRAISKQKFAFLKTELSYMEEQGEITTEKRNSLLSLYEVKANVSFIRVLLAIGSSLIGIGILSFIASNWSELPKFVKFLLILVGIMGSYVAGWKYESKYPKTSRSLYYVGMFIYGAGIFLIGQMFHISSDPRNAFGAWALGILPMAVYLRDRWIGLFLIIFVFLYAWSDEHLLGGLYLAIPVIYLLNHFKLQHSKMVFFFQNLFVGFTIVHTLYVLEWREELFPILLFIFGIILTFLPLPHYRSLLQWQGALFYGLNGIILTFSEYWSAFEMAAEDKIPLFFTPLFALFLFYLIKRGHLAAILVVCMLIIRFYVDFSYDFLPKSLIFILGGLLLLGCGFWFERNRRKGTHTDATKEA